jgi:hypothetical protein
MKVFVHPLLHFSQGIQPTAPNIAPFKRAPSRSSPIPTNTQMLLRDLQGTTFKVKTTGPLLSDFEYRTLLVLDAL